MTTPLARLINPNNIILKTDAYKLTHHLQYPEGTSKIYSYMESRGGPGPTVMFGLQGLVKQHLVGEVVTKDMIDEAEAFANSLFATPVYFNRKGWTEIVEKHGGHLPLEIRAVPEGSVIPVKNALMSVENTGGPNTAFLTNALESLLLQTWYPITVASNSRLVYKTIEPFAVNAGEKVNAFHLNNFGFRGVSSNESSGIGGAAHLVNFAGTDTLQGIVYANNYYNAGICGGSVLASEHSTTTSWGEHNEVEAFRRFLTINPKAPVSIVIDSYDTLRATRDLLGGELKNVILAREAPTVFRPDSGDPVQTTLLVLDILFKVFGGDPDQPADAAYKRLHPKVKVIWGDGIDLEDIYKIMMMLESYHYAPSNVIFGMGGGLLQKCNRDSYKFAFKCSSAVVNGVARDVYKQPKTQPDKASKKGRLALVLDRWGNYHTVEEGTEAPYPNLLQPVFRDGELLREQTFEEIRNIAAASQL